MQSRQSGLSQEAAAVKSGMSVRSGRRVERGERDVPKPRHWRTREVPLAAVWASHLVPLLERCAVLTGRHCSSIWRTPLPVSTTSRYCARCNAVSNPGRRSTVRSRT